MQRVELSSAANKKALHTHNGYDDEPTLVTTTHPKYSGVFKATTITSAATYVLVAPDVKNGVVLTDLIITAPKKGGTLTIRFTDGTNTVTIITTDQTEAPLNWHIPFAGHWSGWQGCRVEAVSSIAMDGTITVGYYRTPERKTLAYGAWNARR